MVGKVYGMFLYNETCDSCLCTHLHIVSWSDGVCCMQVR